MPNLINVLRKPSESPDTSKLTDDERRKMVEYELKGGEGSDSRGMDWGTCLIFSCEKDCCREGSSDKQIKECWREELVIIQKDE
jgi:pre-rRNA-processing protein TSR4